MNQIQMIQLLNTLETPSVYDHALEGQALPFIAIHITQPDNFSADNQVYVEKSNFRIVLYTVNKDLTIEASIKKLLNDNGVSWVRTEEYLNDEKCYAVEFEFEVIGNDEEASAPVAEGGSDGES